MTETQTGMPPMEKARKEHELLKRLVGDWRVESECGMGSGQEPIRQMGQERVRLLGNFWAVLESKGEVPGAGVSTNILTIGYDPRANTYVGTFISSCMSHLWVYEKGTLEGNVLTLHAKGPRFDKPGQSTNFKDVMEFKSDDHRILTGYFQTEDGQWQQM